MTLITDSYFEFIEKEISACLYDGNYSDFLLGVKKIENEERVAIEYSKEYEDGKKLYITVAEVPILNLDKMTEQEWESSLALMVEIIAEEKKLTSFDMDVLRTICKRINMFNWDEACIKMPYGTLVGPVINGRFYEYENAFTDVEKVLKKLSDYSITYRMEDGDQIVSGTQKVYLVGYEIRRCHNDDRDMIDEYCTAELVICPSSYFWKWWMCQERELTPEEKEYLYCAFPWND